MPPSRNWENSLVSREPGEEEQEAAGMEKRRNSGEKMLADIT